MCCSHSFIFVNFAAIWCEPGNSCFKMTCSRIEIFLARTSQEILWVPSVLKAPQEIVLPKILKWIHGFWTWRGTWLSGEHWRYVSLCACAKSKRAFTLRTYSKYYFPWSWFTPWGVKTNMDLPKGEFSLRRCVKWRRIEGRIEPGSWKWRIQIIITGEGVRVSGWQLRKPALWIQMSFPSHWEPGESGMLRKEANLVGSRTVGLQDRSRRKRPSFPLSSRRETRPLPTTSAPTRWMEIVLLRPSRTSTNCR